MTFEFDDPAQAEVWASLRALNDAWTTGDPARLAEYFHPQMVAITATDRLRLTGRDACLASWQGFAQAARIHRWRELEPLVQLYGDTAIVTYYFDMAFDMGGRRIDMGGRDMFVFVREHGRWWAVADHSRHTRIRYSRPMSSPDSQPLRLIAPPPALYFGALLLGVALHVVAPIAVMPARHVLTVPGGVLMVLSGAFARWAFLTMRRSGATANPKKPSEALTTDGPFRVSRNPIYVAMTGLSVGLAFLVNFAWPLLLLAPLLALMQWGVVLREERYLAGKFGDDYAAYRARVRRWL